MLIELILIGSVLAASVTGYVALVRQVQPLMARRRKVVHRTGVFYPRVSPQASFAAKADK